MNRFMKIWVTAWIVILVATLAFAAGTVTVSENTVQSVKKITWSWTAAGGAADQATTAAFDGDLIGFATIPGTAGDQPDDNYDVTITDADGLDVLLGQGANRDETNTEYVARASIGAVSGSVLTVNVSNAGTTNKGTVILWLR